MMTFNIYKYVIIEMKNFRKISLLTFLLLAFAAVRLCAGRHYTVIVSLDGCRWDYPMMYDTPFLDSLGSRGVSAVMRPSFPSKTFPNHYTLATGLVPDHHGIIANRFYDVASGRTYSISDKATSKDGSFYGGEPIWLTAKRQGVKVGVVYWPGSDVAIKGMYPDYYKDYAKKPLLTFPERLDEAERLLTLPDSVRPQLVMIYFNEPDHSGHSYGPASQQTRKAVEELDSLMCSLYKRLRALPCGQDINFIVTSDHGMASTSPERIIRLSEYLKPEWCERVMADLPTLIFPKKGHEDDIMNALKGVAHIRTWKKDEVPECFHYGTNRNIAPIVVMPDVGWVVSEDGRVIPGNHGFDPYNSELNVPFRAEGPDFKHGYVKTAMFDNTCIYPLLSRLLGIEPAPCDGNIGDVADMLAPVGQ